MGQGYPVYRLVRSEYVMEKVGGLWNEWNADLNVTDRGGIVTGETGAPSQSSYRPDRVVPEVREVQTYSHLDEQGWMLERWYPAAFFGSPTWWAAQVVKGTNLPKFGPYPSEGRYLAICGPMQREPSMSFLEDFISSWEERRASFPDDVEKHIRQRVRDAEIAEEKRSEHAKRENSERLAAKMEPVVSTTLEAGRWRSRQFEKAGYTSHIGN